MLARRCFFVSVLMLAFLYGVGATHYNLFPVSLMRDAKLAAQQLLEDSGTVLAWYFTKTTRAERIGRHEVSAVMPGLRLVNGIAADQKTVVSVVDVSGKAVHEWKIDWYKLWPAPTHLEEALLPKNVAAALVHGVVVAPNGDLVFNFEKLGMMRLDACGQVVWRLPYRTHHTIHLDEAGHIWAPGVITRYERRASRPNFEPPWEGYTVVEVSPEGQILREWSIADLLIENGLNGLLYLSNIKNRSITVTGDTLHLNAVEIFPASMTPGVFSKGDVMISLRNINAILVFDPESGRIKFQSIGTVLRQHDPEFVDGNTVSVFNNNNLGVSEPDEINPKPNGSYSRIDSISAVDGRVTTIYEGSDSEPFFSDIMGAQQRLPNGNTLIAETIPGRVFEIDRTGRVVWEYFNIVSEGLIGLVPDAMWLPPQYDTNFFARARSACAAPSN